MVVAALPGGRGMIGGGGGGGGTMTGGGGATTTCFGTGAQAEMIATVNIIAATFL